MRIRIPQRDLTQWHRWFAWRPVEVAPGDWRWLEFVRRAGEFHIGIFGGLWLWTYHPLEDEVRP